MTLTNIKDDYILEYVDHPFLPQEKDSPHRILIIIIGFLVSFFSAVTLLFIFLQLKKKAENQHEKKSIHWNERRPHSSWSS